MFRVGGTRQISLLNQSPKPLGGSKATFKNCARNYRTSNRKSNGRSFSSTSKKGSSGLKIGAGIALVAGSGAIGGGILYNYNEDFRQYVNQSLPINETLNLALGPAVNDKKVEDEEESFLKPKKADLKPFIDTKAVVDEKLIDNKKNVASLSSLDQVAVSSVDLDIATTVEDEVTQTKKDNPPPPSKTPPKPPGGGGGGKESVASFVSAVDQPGVSVIDQDIARGAEVKTEIIEQVEQVSQTVQVESKPFEPQSQEIPQSSPVFDTSLTEKELESLVDQTTMEVLVNEALQILNDTCDEAVKAQQEATRLLGDHVKQLKKALENDGHGSVKDWSATVLDSQKEAEEAIATAKTLQTKANQEVERVYSVVKEAEASGAQEAAVKGSKEAARVSYEVMNAVAELQKIKSEDMVLEEHKRFLDESRTVLKNELEEILPKAAESSEDEEDSNEDVRSEAILLAYARKRLDHLKNQLANQREEEQKRLEQVLNIQRQEDEKLAEIKIKQQLDKLKADFEVTLKKRESELASEHETTLRQQLRRQAAAYSDNLNEVLQVQANELELRFNDEFTKKLNEEKQEFSSKLKTALAQVRGMEKAVESRVSDEKHNQQNHKVWLACRALETAIENGIKVLKPLDAEVSAITAAAQGDPVMSDIVGAIPQEAIERGVFSEKNLAARFSDVKKSCRKVAMIGQDNKGPWTYFLSYIQSFFIFDKFDPKVNGEMVDLESADTFELLSRAEYYVREGDLELAARFVNQLQGEPRKLAYDWLREVRLLLETKQAVRFLSTYATATGMN